MATASVTIDASVLAVPSSLDASDEETYHYVDTILDWSRILNEPWVAVYMSEEASGALLEDGLYPLRDQLRDLFRRHGIVEYDVNTVSRVVDRLLQITPSFECYFRVRDVLADKVSTAPDIKRLGSGSQIRSDLARCLVLIAILRRHCRPPIRDHTLILRRATGRIVNVRALIHDLEHTRDDLETLRLPARIEGDVLVCNDFCGLLEGTDEAAMLADATDDLAIETAIRIALYKSRITRSGNPDWIDLGGMRLGRAFCDDLRRCCRDAGSSFPATALRAIVETIEKENLAAAHALRTGMGGGDPQLIRTGDLAKAWRRDVDREYHLHYWDCGGGVVELASIGVHNDFSIPE
ncbi:MAG: hypothetical protein GXY76_00045 [Chloroflexi bacterium]|nr:hypothetical protein [Chloroflexota bacterium]